MEMDTGSHKTRKATVLHSSSEGADAEPADSTTVLLGARRVSKSYGGVAVLRDVSVEFRGGEVHALLGENGAGKSTLVKIIAGVITADHGELYGDAYAAGDIAMVFQELSVVPDMSVLDNLVLAARRRGPMVPYRTLRRTAAEALTSAGLGYLNLTYPVAALSLAQRQLLEIARALMVDARVLILDEPSATLSDVEIDQVHGVVRDLVADGRAVIYITHRLGEVFSLSHRVTIMRSGEVVASAPTSQFAMRDVITQMLGADHVGVQKTVRETGGSADGARFAVRGLRRPQFSDVSFSVRPGEILALFGQIGSGADAVVETLAGIQAADYGTVWLDGQQLRVGSRARAQRDGVAYVSADRAAEGVFLDASVEVNISSGALRKVSRGGIIRKRAEKDLGRRLASAVSFDHRRLHEPVSAFSGGNQQKVAIARALATEPRVLILNEPTRGVDIGARSEIYRSIRDLLARNVIVIAYSSDIIEIRELADRVVTMFRGAIVSENVVDDIDDATLTAEILHGATHG